MAITADDLRRLADTFDWSAWNTRVREAVEPSFRTIATAQAEREAAALDVPFDGQDPYVSRWFTKYLGERITQIDETTRTRVRSILQSALEAGGQDANVQMLAERIRAAVKDVYPFSPARALVIARTETAFAYNAGAVLSFRQNGIRIVRVSDGDYDSDCRDADGQRWSIEYALEHLLEHPNCVRTFTPDGDQDTAPDRG